MYFFSFLQSVIFDEINLPDLSVAECSTKNANHSFQVKIDSGCIRKFIAFPIVWPRRCALPAMRPCGDASLRRCVPAAMYLLGIFTS